MRDRSSRGFTVLELAIAMTVFGILAEVAIPNYLGLMRDVHAAQAVADIQAVRAAAYMYFGDHQEWPPEEQGGIVPESLKPYLPKDVVFYKSIYRIDWDNWAVTDATGKVHSRFPQTGVLAGISLITPDRDLEKAIRGLLKNASVVTVGSRTTLVVAGDEGF